MHLSEQLYLPFHVGLLEGISKGAGGHRTIQCTSQGQLTKECMQFALSF